MLYAKTPLKAWCQKTPETFFREAGHAYFKYPRCNTHC